MDIFERIKSLVRSNGTTIESMLNDAGGISLNTYNGWKKRGVVPRADEAVEIARILGVSVEYLVTGKDPLYENERVAAIARACNSASDLELAMIEKILDIPIEGKNTDIQETL